MSRIYLCDQCEATQTDPMSFEVRQLTEEVDDDGDTVIEVFHLCSAQCLSAFATGAALDFEGD